MKRSSYSAALGLITMLGGLGTATGATLSHHYDFSSGVVDLAGSANGTLIGGANVASGQLNLDGSDDYVQFASSLVPTSGSYSVALFGLRTANQATFTELISQGATGGPGFYIGTDPAGKIRASDQWQSTGVDFGTVGNITHYALVVDASAGTSNLYVNGAIQATLPFAILTNAAGTPTRLGRQFDPFTEYFSGSIKDVRIYAGALTALEVSQLASPVPEPSTYALMAIGLLLITTRASRRTN